MVYRLPWRRPLAAHAAPAMRQPRPVQSIGRATRLQHCTAPVAAGAARCLLLYHAIGPGVWRLAKHHRGVAICPSCPSHRSGVAARPDAAASSVIISHVRATTGQSRAGGEHWQHAGVCVPTIAHHGLLSRAHVILSTIASRRSPRPISLPISHHAQYLHGRLSASPARAGGAQAMNSHTGRPVHARQLFQGNASRECAPQLAAQPAANPGVTELSLERGTRSQSLAAFAFQWPRGLSGAG